MGLPKSKFRPLDSGQKMALLKIVHDGCENGEIGQPSGSRQGWSPGGRARVGRGLDGPLDVRWHRLRSRVHHGRGKAFDPGKGLVREEWRRY